jgi:hypothetical protein
MKKTELTEIIREIVAEEIRIQLPSAIAEVFQNFMGKKSTITERVESKKKDISEEIELKKSLKELMDGPSIMPSKSSIPKAPRKYTKNPILNEVLNETRPFNSQERFQNTAMGGGMVASMQSTSDVPFTKNTPNMGDLINNNNNELSPPISHATLLREDHAPLSALPEGISVLDVKQSAPPEVKKALTRNYSEMMKLIDKKKKGII